MALMTGVHLFMGWAGHPRGEYEMSTLNTHCYKRWQAQKASEVVTKLKHLHERCYIAIKWQLEVSQSFKWFIGAALR